MDKEEMYQAVVRVATLSRSHGDAVRDAATALWIALAEEEETAQPATMGRLLADRVGAR